LLGAQDKPPKLLNTAEVAEVFTLRGYFLRVRNAHAVTGVQSHLTTGYTVVVTPLMLIATGINTVAVAGMF
jgi:hypothetical protein